MAHKKDTYGFWENPVDTIGFASCDMCKGGEQVHSERTVQNGRTTLCKKHYDAYKNSPFLLECRDCGVPTKSRRCSHCEADNEHIECNSKIVLCQDCKDVRAKAEEERLLWQASVQGDD